MQRNTIEHKRSIRKIVTRPDSQTQFLLPSTSKLRRSVPQDATPNSSWSSPSLQFSPASGKPHLCATQETIFRKVKFPSTYGALTSIVNYSTLNILLSESSASFYCPTYVLASWVFNADYFHSYIALNPFGIRRKHRSSRKSRARTNGDRWQPYNDNYFRFLSNFTSHDFYIIV